MKTTVVIEDGDTAATGGEYTSYHRRKPVKNFVEPCSPKNQVDGFLLPGQQMLERSLAEAARAAGFRLKT
jgi:hypothetical protein